MQIEEDPTRVVALRGGYAADFFAVGVVEHPITGFRILPDGDRIDDGTVPLGRYQPG